MPGMVRVAVEAHPGLELARALSMSLTPKVGTGPAAAWGSGVCGQPDVHTLDRRRRFAPPICSDVVEHLEAEHGRVPLRGLLAVLALERGVSPPSKFRGEVVGCSRGV